MRGGGMSALGVHRARKLRGQGLGARWPWQPRRLHPSLTSSCPRVRAPRCCCWRPPRRAGAVGRLGQRERCCRLRHGAGLAVREGVRGCPVPSSDCAGWCLVRGREGLRVTQGHPEVMTCVVGSSGSVHSQQGPAHGSHPAAAFLDAARLSYQVLWGGVGGCVIHGVGSRSGPGEPTSPVERRGGGPGRLCYCSHGSHLHRCLVMLAVGRCSSLPPAHQHRQHRQQRARWGPRRLLSWLPHAPAALD